MLALLLIDHATRSCRLRTPPDPPVTGRPSRLEPGEVRRARYDYWTGARTCRRIARDMDVTPTAASLILRFKRLAWV